MKNSAALLQYPLLRQTKGDQSTINKTLSVLQALRRDAQFAFVLVINKQELKRRTEVGPLKAG